MTYPASQVFPDRIRVVDSHTEGESTRVVIDGWPGLRGETMTARCDELRDEWDHLRRAAICEPRGHEAMVGALLTPPVSNGSEAGVIFFNNVGYLGMCGHGLMGVVRTLEHLGRVGTGMVTLDTPVGTVGAQLNEDGSVTIRNVPAYCHARGVEVQVPGAGTVRGAVAWGGNWFFITRLAEPALEPANRDELIRVTRAILRALADQGVTGEGGEEIDHAELFGPPDGPGADARSFVLCPGGVYDRSPCGTGTSAKMAVLYAEGALAPGQEWRQESLTGGVFTGWLEVRGRELIPWIRGRAWITGEAELRFDRHDLFRAGLPAT